MYGLCVSFASAGGKMPHAPPKEVPELDIFGYFSAKNETVWTTNTV